VGDELEGEAQEDIDTLETAVEDEGSKPDMAFRLVVVVVAATEFWVLSLTGLEKGEEETRSRGDSEASLSAVGAFPSMLSLEEEEEEEEE